VEDKFGFTQVTKVQNAVIPLFLSNKDVCVKACTGSGKTIAFVVPLVSKLLKIMEEKMIQAHKTKNIEDGNETVPVGDDALDHYMETDLQNN
jgi:superfamily II DNA/RNA helicase